MALNNPLDACTPELLPDVMQYGGKFGPLENLRRRPEFERHILPTEYVMPGQSFEGDSQFDRPYVRAGHPIDIHDMVGVLETLPAASRSNKDVNEIIQTIRRQASMREVIGFANYTANSDVFYNPDDVVIGVQPHIQGLRASILRHPNRPEGDDEFVISWFRNAAAKSSDGLASGLEIYSATFDIAGRIRYKLGDTLTGKHQPNMFPRRLIDLYRRVEATGIMRDDRVFMMEAVGNENDLSQDPYICQLRDFKEKDIADWRIDEAKTGHELPKLVFGVTPERGIKLRVVHSPDCYGKDKKPLTSLSQPWGLLKTQHQTEPPLGFQPTNMKAYLAGFRFGSGMASLAHMQERLAAIADVTVFENRRPLPTEPISGRQQSDFSNQMVAEMADRNDPNLFSEFQLHHGTKLDVVRSATARASRNTDYQPEMLEYLEATREATVDIVLQSDGYRAKIMQVTQMPVTSKSAHNKELVSA